MPRAITILTDNFADWETALFNASARYYFGFDVRYAAPQGKPLLSSGGLLVTPQLAIDEIELDGLDVLLVCGGPAWQSAGAPDIGALLAAAQQRGIVLAGICDGTRVLAQAGVLDHVRHTSNSADNLATLSGYAGAALYQDVPHAVTDRGVITAPGTAPVTFTAAVLAALGIAGDELQAYLALHAREHGPQG